MYLQYVPCGAARLPERDRPCGLSDKEGEDVYAAIALTNCVTGRTSLGGTCVASVEAQIASVRDFLAGQTEAAKQARNG